MRPGTYRNFIAIEVSAIRATRTQLFRLHAMPELVEFPRVEKCDPTRAMRENPAM